MADLHGLIGGLTAANFALTEQSEGEAASVAETITTVEETQGSALMNVSLVIDVSGSMDGSGISAARIAAKGFVDRMLPADKACVVAFADDATVRQSLTSDKNALKTAIDGLYPGGWTSMYDGVYLGLEQLSGVSGVQALIVLADGEDNNSWHTNTHVIDYAKSLGAPIYSIGLGGSLVPTHLQDLSDNTGGYYVQAPTPAVLQHLYEEIARNIGNQYRITYTSHNNVKDEAERTVTITASTQTGTASGTAVYRSPFVRLWVDIVTRDRVRIGREEVVSIRCGNAGNVVSQPVLLMTAETEPDKLPEKQATAVFGSPELAPGLSGGLLRNWRLVYGHDIEECRRLVVYAVEVPEEELCGAMRQAIKRLAFEAASGSLEAAFWLYHGCRAWPTAICGPSPDECGPSPPPVPQPDLGNDASASTDICVVTSIDPNGKAGLSGFGLERFIPGIDRPLQYTIYFENVATASAAAESIQITDQLDPNLDWTWFEFGESSHPSVMQTSFDKQTGLATWTFQNINLPPNVNPPEGEGYVTFTIKPKKGLTTGTEIKNKATIDFEIGYPPAPMDTPEVLNTIDAGAPMSSVNALSESQLQATFDVSWTGTDDEGGSGIGSYTIYVSDNDSPYEPWLTDTAATSGSFVGVAGHTYKFYSVAKDNVGNSEPATPNADATTTVVPTVSVPNVVGLARAAAETAITGAGLTVGAVTEANSDTVDSGNVISQDPAAGATVPMGTPVALVVSKGPANRIVPNVVGMTRAAAESAIASAGLVVGAVTESYSDTVDSGHVISQDPAAGASVAPGTAVALVVSKGPKKHPFGCFGGTTNHSKNGSSIPDNSGDAFALGLAMTALAAGSRLSKAMAGGRH